MNIRGKLSNDGARGSRSIADLVEWVHNDHKNGVLRVWRDTASGSVRKDFWFEAGEIVASGTSEPREYLGSFLISQGRITERDFVACYRTQLETKILFGKVLVDAKLVTEREVELALKEKTEESLWDVFLWPEGKFDFDDAGSLPANRLPVALAIPALVSEGERRLIDMAVIRKTVPHLEVDLAVIGSAAGATPLEQRMLGGIAADKTLPALALELRQSEYLFLRRIAELVRRGVLKVLQIRPDTVAATEPAVKFGSDAPPPMSETGSTLLYPTGEAGEVIPISEMRIRIPVMRLARERVEKERFTPEEGYLLSRIDGVFDMSAVASLCPFRESVAFAAVADLARRGIVALQKP